MKMQETQERVGGWNITPATLYTFFLPLNHNDGHRMPPVRLEWAQGELLSCAGGLTRFRPGVGYWVGHLGKVYRDSVLPTQVTSTDPEAEARFVRLAAEMAAVLEQQQVFLLTQPVCLVEHTPLRWPVAVATPASVDEAA